MNIFGYDMSQTELLIATTLIGTLVGLYVLAQFPKGARAWILLFVFLGGIGSAFWLNSEQRETGAKPEAVSKSAPKETAQEKQAKNKQSGEEAGQRSFKPTNQANEVSGGEAAAPENDKYKSVKVLYGTDRAVSSEISRIKFEDGRARKLNLGTATVTVPKNVHKTGEIERPYEYNFLWIKIKGDENPEKHFTVHKIGALSKEEFISLSKQINSKSRRFKDQAFVFIHGYNVSFDSALYRTAQMAYDLGFDGVPYMYSWPSVGGLTNYEYDQNSAQQSRPYLREYLDIITKETGVKDVHIVAHSMGNAPLMEVLRDLRLRPEQERVSNINQVILAAPDIDRDVFINLAKEIKGLSKGITLYVSSADLAMKASRAYSGSIRAGDVSEDGPIVLDGIDTIDVTKLSTSMFYSLNHALYADSSKILVDITKIMLKQIRPPDERSEAIQRVDKEGGQVFWRYDE